MSWGERSCKWFNTKESIPVNCHPSLGTCDPQCRAYENNGTPTEAERIESARVTEEYRERERAKANVSLRAIRKMNPGIDIPSGAALAARLKKRGLDI